MDLTIFLSVNWRGDLQIMHPHVKLEQMGTLNAAGERKFQRAQQQYQARATAITPSTIYCHKVAVENKNEPYLQKKEEKINSCDEEF